MEAAHFWWCLSLQAELSMVSVIPLFLLIKNPKETWKRNYYLVKGVLVIYATLIVNSMSRVTFGNSASEKQSTHARKHAHTHILQLDSDNSIKFMSRKNKLIFITWKEMSLSKNHRIFSWWLPTFTTLYCVAAVSTVQVIQFMTMTSSHIVPATAAYC